MKQSASGYQTIRSEGGLLPPSLLSRVAAGDPTLPGLRPDDYHLAGNERINELISRSWTRLQGAWAAFRDALSALPDSDAATGLTRERWLLVLLFELGYGRLSAAKGIVVNARAYALSHEWGSVAIHLVGAHLDMDKRTPGVAGAAR